MLDSGEHDITSGINVFQANEAKMMSIMIADFLTKLLKSKIDPDLIVSLGNGVVLCQAFQALVPKIQIGRYHKDPRNVPFRTENVYFFGEACKKLGIKQSSIVSYKMFTENSVREIAKCLVIFFKSVMDNKDVSVDKETSMRMLVVVRKCEEVEKMDHSTITEDMVNEEVLAKAIEAEISAERVRESLRNSIMDEVSEPARLSAVSNELYQLFRRVRKVNNQLNKEKQQKLGEVVDSSDEDLI